MNVLKKILIVEDDQLLNRTLAYNLTSDGYEVISVFNFDSAVRKLRENEFDVALLDINLPDGSGLDLCEETVSYTHLRAHETDSYLVCRLLLEKKKKICIKKKNNKGDRDGYRE